MWIKSLRGVSLIFCEGILLNVYHTSYRHPNDIDIFAGGMSEKPVEGGVLGPLFACLVGHQFQNLKNGDRFYYENQDDTGFSAGNN